MSLQGAGSGDIVGGGNRVRSPIKTGARNSAVFGLVDDVVINYSVAQHRTRTIFQGFN